MGNYELLNKIKVHFRCWTYSSLENHQTQKIFKIILDIIFLVYYNKFDIEKYRICENKKLRKEKRKERNTNDV